jgi:hypothetical protein
MRTFFKNSAIVLALTGVAFATAPPAGAAGITIDVGSGRGDRHGNGAAISLSFGDIAFGYRDGYWDNSHRWHRWNNDRDYRNYRTNHTGYYRDWNHDRDGGDGWARDGNFGFDQIAFGYRDGYWDNGHRWHRWNSDRDARNYRSHYAGSYSDWNHDRDGNDGWNRGRRHGGNNGDRGRNRGDNDRGH